jgi:hypothetical protein
MLERAGISKSISGARIVRQSILPIREDAMTARDVRLKINGDAFATDFEGGAAVFAFCVALRETGLVVERR